VKLSSLTIRQIAIDAAPRYGTEGIPAGRPAAWHYPLVILHMDVGIDGYTMGCGNQGDSRAIACLVRDVFWPKIRGENPLEIERLWLRLRRSNRDLYALSDALSGMLDVARADQFERARTYLPAAQFQRLSADLDAQPQCPRPDEGPPPRRAGLHQPRRRPLLAARSAQGPRPRSGAQHRLPCGVFPRPRSLDRFTPVR